MTTRYSRQNSMEQVLQEIISINPPFFEHPITTIGNLYKTRHWFQLGKEILELLNQPAMDGEKMNFYNKFVQKFGCSLDPLHRAQIVYLVSQDCSSPQAAIQFLEENLSKSKEFKDAYNWLSLQIASKYIINGEFETALQKVYHISLDLNEHSNLTVRSLYYKVKSMLDKAQGDYDTFYKDALYYLSTTPNAQDIVIAYDLCEAALISKSVCSFGELAAHPILETLKNGENKWIYELILLLDNGSPEIIDQFESQYLPIIKSKSHFSKFMNDIKFKVTISVLTQLIFSKPFESRIFTFEEVSSVCKIPKDQVEIVVLRALSAQIIKGFIDEIDERIVVTWCKPKALSRVRLEHLKAQIDRWIQRVHEQRVLLDMRSQNFFS